jgi:hypothetical protein
MPLVSAVCVAPASALQPPLAPSFRRAWLVSTMIENLKTSKEFMVRRKYHGCNVKGAQVMKSSNRLGSDSMFRGVRKSVSSCRVFDSPK